MDQKELAYYIRMAAVELGVKPVDLRPIPKSELVAGRTYRGSCRNSFTAVWDGSRFEYERYEFGSYYPEKINHYEDDNGYDLFVPVEKIKKDDA